MKTSVIVITKDEEEYIKACLESIKNQTKKDLEVILVDGSSSDDTVRIAERYTKKIFQADEKGRAFARNLGIKKSKFDIVVFIDADAVAEPSWIDNLARRLSDKRNFIVTGKTIHKAKKRNLLSQILTLDSSYRKKFGGEEVKTLDTANCAIKKTLFKKVGLFDEKFERIEDTKFTNQTLKSGYKIMYEPLARVVHYDISDKFQDFFKKEVEHGKYFSQLFLKDRNFRGYEHIRPWLYLQPLTYYSLITPFYPYNLFLILFFTLILNLGFFSYVLRKRARYIPSTYFLLLVRNFFWFLGNLNFLLDRLVDFILKRK